MELLSESTVAASAWGMIAVGAVTYAALNLIDAPYGRYSSASWGPRLPAWISWMIMESPNLLIPLFLCVHQYKHGEPTNVSRDAANKALLAMFWVHYIHRTIVFPLTMPSTKPMPVAVMLIAFSYCSWNAVNQGASLMLFTRYPANWLSDPQFVLGAAVFFGGMALNIHSDHRLLHLKRQAASEGREYVIPTGGLFQLISCPNYFGEVIEWVGFAIASNSLAGIAFAVYTACNLVPRGRANHAWYRQKFEDYPPSRKAVIPFLW